MYVGVRNDDEYLYVLVKTVDLRAQMKVLRLGLTLWLAPEGKKAGRLGIRYPTGIGEHGIPLFGTDSLRGLSGEQRKLVAGSLHEMEIIGPGQENWVKVARDDSCAIHAAVRDTSEVVVYELRVPLKRTDGSPWGVGAAPGDRIIVEAETGDIRPVRKDPERSDGPQQGETTGMIRDKGRQRDRERSGRPPLMNPLTEPVRFKASVILARNPYAHR
jgi:hypothetical protein